VFNRTYGLIKLPRSLVFPLAGAFVASALIASPGAAAAPTREWTPEAPLTQNGDDNSTWVRPEYFVGSTRDGTAVALWENKLSDGKLIQVSRRAPGGTWSDPQTVRTSRGAWLGDMVVDAAGDVTFTLRRVRVGLDTYKNFVQTMYADGTVGKRHEAPGYYLAGNARGDVMVVNNNEGGGNQTPASYIFRSAGGHWSNPAPAPRPAGLFAADSPRLFMDPDGRVHMVEAYYNEPGLSRQDQIAVSEWNPATAQWSGIHMIASIDNYAESWDAAMNAKGDIVAGWADIYDDQEGFRSAVIRSTYYPEGSTSSHFAKTWATQDDCVADPQVLGVGIDADSNATVGWRQCTTPDSTETSVMAGRREAAARAWGTPTTVTTNPYQVAGSLQVNSQGTTMWLLEKSQSLITFRRPPNGSYGAGQYLTPEGHGVSNRAVFTLEPSSDAAVVYSYYKEHPLYARVFETTAG